MSNVTHEHTAQTGAAPQGTKKKVIISMMTFAIMNVTTILSLRGMPSMAEYGLTSIFYYLFAAIVFLIPMSLVAAELASTFPNKGGVFRWVAEAFGPKWGFAALYYEWQTIVIWFPTVLIFAAAALAYIFGTPAFDASLADNKIYSIIMLLAVFWFVTLFTFRGMGASAKLSSLGGLFGTIIPGAILIILAVVYVMMGKPIQMPLDTGYLPDFSHFKNMVLAAGVFLYFGGIETQAVHIQDLKNPTRDYPLAILIATTIVVVIFVLGTLAVGVVIPHADINLNRSLLIAYKALWASFGLSWIGNIMAAMLAFGVLGQVSAIVAGPSTGLLAVGKAGYLPHMLQKTNANGIPTNILIAQGIIVTILSAAFTILPSVQSAYQILSQMATIIYLLMCLIMFVAGISSPLHPTRQTSAFQNTGRQLRHVDCRRHWRNWLRHCGCLQFHSTSADHLPAVQSFMLESLMAGTVIFAAIPFIFFAFHKPSWKAPDSDFEPLSWQNAGVRPTSKSFQGKPLLVPIKPPPLSGVNRGL